MNKTKYALIITTIVLNFLSAGLNVYLAISSFWHANLSSINIFIGLYEALGAAAYGITSGLLIYAILDGGIHFRARYNYYMTALVLTLCLDLFSVPSILLIITLFMSDIVWIKPTKEEKQKPEPEKTTSDKEREQKIANLRKLKDNGTITQEEFDEELFKLL